MAVLLTDLSPSQLTELIAQASKRKQILKKRKPVAVVRKKLEAAAATHGYSIAELFGSTAHTTAPANAPATTRAGAKVAPKYRNPDAPEQTWSGRGLKPVWLRDALTKRGAKIEDFLI